MIIVSNNLVLNNQWYGRTINDVLRVFIIPYYTKIQKTFNQDNFSCGLVEMFESNQTPNILLNDKVSLEIEFKEPKLSPNDVNKDITIDLKEIKSLLRVNDELDVNSAKILIVKFNKDFWVLNFDFRYNKWTASVQYDRAKEFLSGCKTILRKKEYCPHVIIYLLRSTAELIIDTILSLRRQSNKRNQHKERIEKLKIPLIESHFSAEFCSMFILLSEEKNPARYASKDYTNKYEKKYFQKNILILEKEFQKISID